MVTMNAAGAPSAAMHAAPGSIQDEHHTLAAVRHGWKFVVQDIRTSAKPARFQIAPSPGLLHRRLSGTPLPS
jgi:hypothetical protein